MTGIDYVTHRDLRSSESKIYESMQEGDMACMEKIGELQNILIVQGQERANEARNTNWILIALLLTFIFGVISKFGGLL